MSVNRIAQIALVVAATALAAGCTGGGGGVGAGTTGKESAADFVHRITIEFSRGQSGRLWDELHPADQALVTRAAFVACEHNDGFNLKSFKVLESYDEPIDVNGKTSPSTAVSVRATSEDGETTATMHAVSVGGTWRWILQPADAAAYTKGKCP
jgi:hypothetical protein